MAKIDVDELIAETDLGEIIVDSTSGGAQSPRWSAGPDVRLDRWIDSVVDRVLRRHKPDRPVAPPSLATSGQGERR